MSYSKNYSEWVEDNDVDTNYRKTQLEFNRQDNDFVELKRRTPSGAIKKVGCFRSGFQGSYIRNAVSGIKDYRHKVGSFDEDLYFKVNVATGENVNSSSILFFDNPKECENHFFSVLNPDIKEKWQEKFNTRRINNQLLEYEQEQRRTVIVH